MNSTVYLYVFDTMADGEMGYLTAELNSGRYFKKRLPQSKIVTLGVSKTPITTMGGMKILPEIDLKNCSIKSIDALILPGGDTWMESIYVTNNKYSKAVYKGEYSCSGDMLRLAENELLDSKWHTSNDFEYFKMMCPDYKDEKYYKNEPVVIDGKLITASGVTPLEFSVHVLIALDVFLPKTLDI